MLSVIQEFSFPGLAFTQLVRNFRQHYLKFSDLKNYTVWVERATGGRVADWQVVWCHQIWIVVIKSQIMTMLNYMYNKIWSNVYLLKWQANPCCTDAYSGTFVFV